MMYMSTHRKLRLKKQKGSALVTVLVLFLVLSITGLAFFSLSSYDAGLAERRREEAQSFCNAESGAERARWALLETWSKSSSEIDSAGLVADV